MEDRNHVGQGMTMSKMVDGKPVPRHAIKGDTIARMDMIVEMDQRRKKYVAEQDWANLAKLAEEYFLLGAVTMAGEVSREIPSIK